MSRSRIDNLKSRDEDALAYWREVFPGVPDEAIVLPRYTAKNLFGFPPARLHGTDDAYAWRILGDILDMLVMGAAPGNDQFGKGRNERLRRDTMNLVRRAIRWWSSLAPVDALKMNQSLYMRRDKWKHPADYPELLACLGVCWVWMISPPKRRARAEVLRVYRRMVREAIKRFETGVTWQDHPRASPVRRA